MSTTPSATPAAPLRVLCLGDAGSAELALDVLRKAGFRTESHRVETRGEFEACLATKDYDLVLSDMGAGSWSGPEALDLMHERAVDLPFILVSADVPPEEAVAAVKHGASDCVPRDQLDRLPQAVSQALAERRVREERRRARRALAESERRFRALAHASVQLLWLVDAEGRMGDKLTRWQTFTGQTPEQCVGHGWLDAVHPEQRDGTLGALRAALARGQPFQLEFELRKAGGGYRHFEFHCAPVKDAEGRVLEWVGGGVDLSERLAAVRVLDESEQRYRALSEACFDGLVITEHGIIREATRGLALLLATTAEELAGAPLVSVVEPESQGMVASHLASGGVRRFAFQARARDGRRLELEALCRPVVQEGRTVHLTGLRDVTAQRELERQFVQGQRLEAVGQLAGGVAHDFNNILTSVLGFSQFLLDQLPEDSPLREDALEIHRAGEQGAALTRKLLAFGGRHAPHPHSLDLNRLLEDCASTLRRGLGEHIRVDLELQARPAGLEADPAQLEQVVLNLAFNARDAMPGGGRLRIRTSATTLSAGLLHSGGVVPAGRYVQLTVADEGVGMTPEVMARMFEPFFTTKAGGKGAGLGLSTVYGIVKQCGGHLVAQSTPGAGSIFDLYFPAGENPAAAPGTARGGSVPAGRTILVVEDTPAILSLAERVLARAGYSLLTAEHGSGARDLAAAPGARIDLILMDLLLPGERGPQVAVDLQRLHPEARLVFISGSMGVSEEAFLPPGRYWFLQKPFTPDQLLHVIRQALDTPAEPAVAGTQFES